MQRITIILLGMAHLCRCLRRTSPALVQAFQVQRGGPHMRRRYTRIDPSRESYYQSPIRISSLNLSNRRKSTAASQSLASATEAPPYLDGLNPSQIEAVTQPPQTITRVIAGPGSGKTRVLTCRIVHLLQQDTRIRVLGVTFTKKAAGEMQKRVEALLREQDAMYQDPNMEMDTLVELEDLSGDPSSFSQSFPPRDLHRVSLGTFHSICSKILRWNGELLAGLPSVAFDMHNSFNSTQLDTNFAIIDQSDQVRIIRELLNAKQNIPADVKPMIILTAIAQIKSQLAQGQNPFSANNSAKPPSFMFKLAMEFYYKYREALLSTNCLDFDDLIYMTRELLMEHPDIKVRLHQRWSHILVDEFQDTSRVQMDLVKLLTSGSLLVVGDADQSIYSWRGAHASSLMDFENELEGHPSGKMKTVYLMENYRSTSNIVKAAQKVISSSDGKKSQSAADKMRQAMKPKRGSGPPPRVVACADAKAEAEFVVDTIKSQLQSGDYDSSKDVALIYRTNSQSRALEEACVKASLPYVIFGSATSFYKRQEIKDTLCFLRWINNGYDKSSMLRAMVTPKRGIGDVALNEFESFCFESQLKWKEVSQDPGPTPLDILLSLSGPTKYDAKTSFDPKGILSSRSLKPLTAFSQQIRSIYSDAMQKPVEKLLSSLASELKLFDHFDKISKSKSEFLERKANFEELQNASRKYSGDGPALGKPKRATTDDDEMSTPLGNFLDDVALVTDVLDAAKADEVDAFVVKLMTIHGSKGMEFDTVFLVGNEDGTLPSSQAIQEGDGSVELEEEKRLCYVAMTRAKTELLMTWRKEVPIFTAEGVRTVKKIRSRFLDVLVKKADQDAEAPKSDGGKLKSTSTTTGTSHVYRTTPNPVPANPVEGRRQYSTYQPAKPKKMLQYPSFNPTSQEGKSSKARTSSQYLYDFNARLQAPHNNKPPTIRKESKKPLYSVSATLPINGSSTSNPGRSSRNEVETSASYRAPPSYAKVAPSASSPTQRKTEVKSMDSTWFYPVGSVVRHKIFGRGVVIQPVQSSEKKLGVLVHFDSGDQKEFCATENEISLTLH